MVFLIRTMLAVSVFVFLVFAPAWVLIQYDSTLTFVVVCLLMLGLPFMVHVAKHDSLPDMHSRLMLTLLISGAGYCMFFIVASGFAGFSWDRRAGYCLVPILVVACYQMMAHEAVFRE